MKWTKNKPCQSGFYWRRFPDGRKEVQQIWKREDFPPFILIHHVALEIPDDCSWSGPIPEPEGEE